MAPQDSPWPEQVQESRSHPGPTLFHHPGHFSLAHSLQWGQFFQTLLHIILAPVVHHLALSLGPILLPQQMVFFSLMAQRQQHTIVLGLEQPEIALILQTTSTFQANLKLQEQVLLQHSLQLGLLEYLVGTREIQVLSPQQILPMTSSWDALQPALQSLPLSTTLVL